MNGRIPCKKCLLVDMTDEADVLRTVREMIDAMPDDQRADDELYARRLEVCRGCESLLKGTCIRCGCYVELRAAKKHQTCPRKHWIL